MSNFPLISIGVPLYNSDKTVRRAIDSLLTQTYENIEVIISDNGSSDDTPAICKEYELRESRVKFFQQATNLGPTKNFDFVLRQAEGEYFMWAAGDDFRTNDFIKVNYEFLKNNLDSVASTSPNIFENQQPFLSNLVTISLDINRQERFKTFFTHRALSHGLFYSLIRTETIKSCPFIHELFFGWDWAIILYLANLGDIHRTDQGLTTFGVHGASMQSDVYSFHGISGIQKLMPFYKFNGKVFQTIRSWSWRERISIYAIVTGLNLRTFVEKFPFLHAILRRIKKNVLRM